MRFGEEEGKTRAKWALQGEISRLQVGVNFVFILDLVGDHASVFSTCMQFPFCMHLYWNFLLLILVRMVLKL